MNTKRDWQDDESVLTSSIHPRSERHSQPLPQITSHPDNNKSTHHDRNTESIPYANIHHLEDQASQGCEIEDDPELAAIANQLRKTSSYAVNPSFTEELRKNLLQQFVAYHTVEPKPIEDLDDIPSSYENEFKHESLLYQTYKYIISLLKRLYRLPRKKLLLSKAWFRWT